VADVQVNGADAALPKTPHQALRLQIALLPEDRKNGLVLGRRIRDNMRLGAQSTSKDDLGAGVTMRQALERVGAPVARISEPVGTLSGGNQQKVLMAKWLARGVKLLLVDEPTRGIDIGAKTQIMTLLRQLTGEGLAVVFVSSELEEVLAIADRIVVMAAGRSVADLERSDPRWTVHDILRIAFEGNSGGKDVFST
jgi:ribose transport system ATP-binding protein/rhamnose transport system ATP-binding protein